jgi:hypothetical protein
LNQLDDKVLWYIHIEGNKTETFTLAKHTFGIRNILFCYFPSLFSFSLSFPSHFPSINFDALPTFNCFLFACEEGGGIKKNLCEEENFCVSLSKWVYISDKKLLKMDSFRSRFNVPFVILQIFFLFSHSNRFDSSSHLSRFYFEGFFFVRLLDNKFLFTCFFHWKSIHIHAAARRIM